MTYYHGGTDWQEGGGDGPMTEHLPECPCNDKSAHPAGCLCCEISSPCICAALRACEQRVAEETEAAMIEFFRLKPSPPHDQHYFADNICAYCVGYSEAFTEAEKFYTNSCLFCGYAGEWSTWICDDCKKEREEEDNEGP